MSYRQYPESYRHNQTYDLQPKTYCFDIDIRLLFLLSVARTIGMNISVERQRIANEPDYNRIYFFPKILRNHNITRDNYNNSIQNNFQ